MDQAWINTLDTNTVVIVPTRSLASTLKETIADYHIAQQRQVWEAPNIITWQDLCQQLWQANRQKLGVRTDAHSLISQQQGLLLWNKVVEQSRHNGADLMLLNVPQTVRAVQRSWRLMHDWQLEPQQIQQQKISDSDQFLVWSQSYSQLLKERNLLDEHQLLQALVSEKLGFPFRRIIWYAFDLTTSVQRRLLNHSEAQGCVVETVSLPVNSAQKRVYHQYALNDDELVAALQQARQLIEEQPDQHINIVIPDLQTRISQVSEVAREVFYPGLSPLQIQQDELVYRFSLGQPLHQWPAIETALLLINGLKGRMTVTDLDFLFRSEFLRQAKALRSVARQFIRYLQRRRIHAVQLDLLATEYHNFIQDTQRRGKDVTLSPEFADFLTRINTYLNDLTQQRHQHKDSTGFDTLAFSTWAEHISEWLSLWGWSTSTTQQDLHKSLNSVQYQLLNRWQQLIKDFATLETVQIGAGLRRVCEILFQMTRDTVFLPKAAASPILISGIYEAIGRPVEVCILTGMDDRYPALPSADPFIGNMLRQYAEFPSANAKTEFAQAQKVIESLLASADEVRISYATQDATEEGISRGSSPLFRQQSFIPQPAPQPLIPPIESSLEIYSDTQGPAWKNKQEIRGGSRIFEYQSNCEFKAFATFQLGFEQEQDAEFGLDSLDRGNIVHRLLERVWGRLQSQAILHQHLEQQTLGALIDEVVQEVLQDEELHLPSDKQQLLTLESLRLSKLLQQWLMVDAARPASFTVVEREEQRFGKVAGIPFKFIIDRLDLLDDGRSVVVDYKTGNVVKNDWLGERLRKPQLPLYAMELAKQKRQPPSGIAFAKVKQHECQYQELAEVDIFKSSNWHSLKTQEQWQEHSARWPAIFEQLAKDFLQGRATVNPIDENTCNYCELKSLCRVSQLRGFDQQNESLMHRGDHA